MLQLFMVHIAYGKDIQLKIIAQKGLLSKTRLLLKLSMIMDVLVIQLKDFYNSRDEPLIAGSGFWKDHFEMSATII